MKKSTKENCGYELTKYDGLKTLPAYIGIYIWHKEQGFKGGVRTGLPLKVAQKMAREILKKG
jgi:hypothetical protein